MTENPSSPTADPTRVRSRIRFARSVLIGFVIAVFATVVIGTATADAVSAEAPASTGTISTEADRAIADLVGPSPADAIAHLPRGFAATMGYRPILEDGRPVNPRGGCSSPVPLPDRFEPLCRTHDFGYDLLRFDTRTGHAPGQWGRRSLDTWLIDSMHASCTNPICSIAASMADAGLTANSWRQRWDTPVPESGGDLVATATLRTFDALARR